MKSLTLEPCPRSGGGVHFWLLGAANRLAAAGISPNAAVEILTAESRGCGRTIPRAEIDAATNKAYAEVRTSTYSRPIITPKQAAWPSEIPNRIAAITATGFAAVDLWEASPVRLTGDGPTAEELVDELFPAGGLLCCGSAPDTFDTRPREDWRGQLGEQAFIVPSRMSKLTGLTKADRRESKRCLDNTGPREYLVVEFDRGSFDDHAARLWALREYAPLVLVVHSGGKSLHGWFRCRGASEATQLRFFRYAVTIGGDHATWAPCQLVRMPEGRRDPQTPQRVLYFDRGAL